MAGEIARDEFEVKEVSVKIRRPAGSVAEIGLAVRCADDVFRYNTTCTVPAGTATIEIKATDWPKNVTTWRSTCVIPPPSA